MASLVPENLCITGDEDFKGVFEVSEELDCAFLMSLLEESSQGEVIMNDDERLRSVIRSLEAEINPDMIMDDFDSAMNNIMPEILLMQSDGESVQELLSMEDLEDHDCLVHQGFDPNFRWVEMEDVVPSSPSEDDMNWYVENEIEFGDCVRDFSNLCYGLVPNLEDHSYGSLWQETYDPIMYN